MSATQLSLLAPPKSPAAISSFHPNEGQSLAEAIAGEERARSQESLVLAWIEARDRRQPGVRFTPTQVHEAFSWWELTSIRRCLSNLTKKGQLSHWPGHRVDGPRGAKESTWGLA